MRTFPLNMDNKHIKVDKYQQIEKFKKKITPFSFLPVSHYGTLSSSAWFCHGASHIRKVLQTWGYAYVRDHE